MQFRKITISITESQFKFIESYRYKHQYKTRSEVIYSALCLLQQNQLEDYYLEANLELDKDLDSTIADGLENKMQ